MDLNEIIAKIQSIPYAMAVFGWVGFGLCAGLAAKILMPGSEKMGWLRTIGFGIGGAFLGSFGAAYMGYPVMMGWNLPGFACAVIGAFVLVGVNKLVTQS
jgi:uncharacterized membrane protein YeaQ/YmgE (transglycosylase-associated protein family)